MFRAATTVSHSSPARVSLKGSGGRICRTTRPVCTAAPRSTASPRAVSSSASTSTSSSADDAERRLVTASPTLACPICLQPFGDRSTTPGGGLGAPALKCVGCRRSFQTSGGILDLCLDAGGAAGAYREPQKSGTKLFQSDVISSVYENGWRQSFAWAGFPGEEEETRLAIDLMRDAAQAGVVLDVSCGSGLFSRRFAASGEFAHVVASDFSESMMKQARAYCEEDPKLAAAMGKSTAGDDAADRDGITKLSFVRADVGRLPFATGSLDAVHAGAAMHCWPSPSAAVVRRRTARVARA